MGLSIKYANKYEAISSYNWLIPANAKLRVAAMDTVHADVVKAWCSADSLDVSQVKGLAVAIRELLPTIPEPYVGYWIRVGSLICDAARMNASIQFRF